MEIKDPNPSSSDPTEDQPTLDSVPSSVPAGLSARYDILGEVGRGGMGIVYKARDRETGAVVALKVLRPEITSDAEVMERFKAELLLARKITHKSVCRVYDLNRFENVAAISMEYIEGESLRSLLRRTDGLSVHHGLRLLGQVMAGLNEAHAQGVVHRDLKPENILIARDGTVKVMDFGVARSVEAGSGRTAALIGTPAYMSPEQALGKTADARSDIYSLGLVMYEMFTGRAPFQADTPVALAMKQVQETPPPLRQFEPDLPERLDRAIGKCLEKDPARRFQHVAELDEALSEQLPAAGAAEAEPVPAPHLSVWRRADSVLLLAAILGLFYFLSWRNSVFPSSKFVLQVDAVSARREAEDLMKRLGHRVPPPVRTELEHQPQQHILDLVAATYGWGATSLICNSPCIGRQVSSKRGVLKSGRFR